MSNKQTKALKLALEALKGSQYRMNQYGYQAMETTISANNEAITAIREALAEPQEKYVYGTPLLDAMTGKANEALDKLSENAMQKGTEK